MAAAQACNRRLVATGIDLGAYNTTENAADFADLRVALRIPKWNVFGDSYGTNLAMTLMRQHPQGIRSVTIDSVEPPEVVTAGSFAPNAREGFDRLFGACMAQPQCWPHSPGMAEMFTKLVRRLEDTAGGHRRQPHNKPPHARISNRHSAEPWLRWLHRFATGCSPIRLTREVFRF